jgi:hypothetical protein
MLHEFLDERVPGELYVVCGWVQGVEPGANVSSPSSHLGSLDEHQCYGYLSYGGVEAWDSTIGAEIA